MNIILFLLSATCLYYHGSYGYIVDDMLLFSAGCFALALALNVLEKKEA